jgi:TonB family protein
VGSVRVATSSGSAALDSAAISAMKSWVFAPEMKDGERVSITVNKAFLFALK